jgi:hypothetical protein
MSDANVARRSRAGLKRLIRPFELPASALPGTLRCYNTMGSGLARPYNGRRNANERIILSKKITEGGPNYVLHMWM